MTHYLRECGYRVIEATDENEALTAMTAVDIDVLVTGLKLRANSGFELSSEAKALKFSSKVVLMFEEGPLDLIRSTSRSASKRLRER